MPLRFDVKDPAESIPLTFDFSPGLASGETLTTSSVAVATYSGSDQNPGALLNGAPALDATSTKVVQPVTGGTNNNDYEFTVTAQTTNAAKALTIRAILPVRE